MMNRRTRQRLTDGINRKVAEEMANAALEMQRKIIEGWSGEEDISYRVTVNWDIRIT